MNTVELINQGESETLEFKRSFSLRDEIGVAISAFSNAKGGAVLVGVIDGGEFCGVDIGANTIENEAGYIKRHTDPQIYPSIKIHEIENKTIIAIEMDESSAKPVFFKNHAYKRVGKTNQRISSAEIRKLALEEKPRLNWDELGCEEASLECIDEETFRWFLSEGMKQRALNISDDSPLDGALTRLKLLKNGRLTNAALLLFSKEPMFLQSVVKCIRFSGNEPVKPYIDFQTLEGNVFELIDKAEEFILRNIRMAAWLVPGAIQRMEKHEYPPDAIREAIVNAVAHRDYGSVSKIQGPCVR